MKILVDKKIKALFCKIVVCILGYALLSLTIVVLNSDYMMLYLFLCVLGMFIAIIGVCYGHFKKQDEIMENAAAKSQNIFLVIRKHVFRVMEREKCTDYSMR